MEKLSPHSPLRQVKALVQERKVRSTYAALTGAAVLGFGFDEMLQVVLDLVPADFYKSMTTYADHKVWQDVYRPTTRRGRVYLKLTIIDDVLIVSFKEL